MPSRSRYVCVINRNRDGYQVPLALHEAGLLEAFVTDFYADDAPPEWLPPILRRRRVEGLPRAAVETSWPMFLLQAAVETLRLPKKPMYRTVGRTLGTQALALALRRQSALYCYAWHVPKPHEIPPGMKVIDFEFHPHPLLGWDILSADARAYPEVAWSLAREEEELRRETVIDSWKHVDAIVCASEMTRRSLEHVSCPSERITVVPYAFAPPTAGVERRPRGACRFLFVGQGIQRKGLHHLIRCWQALNLPEATLTIVSYDIDPGIKALITSSSITLLGRQERSALDALYRSADVFVMPSLVEGFGLVYLEALAAGCHVIGTQNTGLPELPLSDDAVTILEPGDFDGLEGALRDCAERKAADGFDAPAIAAETGNWQWHQFRRAIADHARAVLAG